MFDQELVKWFATLGVGGALAGVMFAFYRKDIKQYTELWKIMAEQMTTIIKENTASNVKLQLMIENQERNQLRRTDIAAIKQYLDPEVLNQRTTDKHQ